MNMQLLISLLEESNGNDFVILSSMTELRKAGIALENCIWKIM